MYGGQQFGSGMGSFSGNQFGGGQQYGGAQQYGGGQFGGGQQYGGFPPQQSYSQPRPTAPAATAPGATTTTPSSAPPPPAQPVQNVAPAMSSPPPAPRSEPSAASSLSRGAEAQIRDLQNQISDLRKENTDLKSTVDQLKSQVKEQQADIKDLTATLEIKDVQVKKTKSDAKKAIRLARQAAERTPKKSSTSDGDDQSPERGEGIHFTPPHRKGKELGSTEWTGIKDREKAKPYSGIQVREVANPYTAGQVKVKVVGVTPDGPAAEAGIEVGDIICSVGTTNITRKAIYHSVMNKANVGDIIQICIERDGERISGEVHLVNQPASSSSTNGGGGKPTAGTPQPTSGGADAAAPAAAAAGASAEKAEGGVDSSHEQGATE